MSLTREEKLQPVQHFNMHDDPLTNIETLHLLIWNRGLCVAGYDADCNVLTTKVYTFAEGDMHAISSIILNEPLVAGPQPVTHIWIAEQRHMLIPQHLFNEDAAAIWLEKFHFITPDETIRTSAVKQPHALGIVYPVSNELLALLERDFPESKIASLSEVLLQQSLSADSDTADLIFLNETAVLTIHQKGKLITHQVGLVDDIHNLVYRLAAVGDAHKIKQEELKVSISGFCIPDITSHELKAFYPKMTIPGSEQFSSFTLLSRLISCAL